MVILDIQDYIDEANRQINDTNNYEQLDFDLIELHTEKIQSEKINLKIALLLTLKIANSLLKEKIKHIKLTIQESLQLVLLIATLVELQNLQIITYNLR